MSEKEKKIVKKQFLKYKKLLIQSLGNKAMDNITINRVCSKMFKNKWSGCHSVDDVPLKKYDDIHYMIVNTDTKKQSGHHWVAVLIKQHKCYIWDSYARNINKILKILTYKLRNKNFHVIDCNFDGSNQYSKSEVCGQLCIAWLLTYDEFGAEKACLV